MPAKTFDDFQKRVDQWTQDMLNDELKMAAWVASKELDEYGLLAKEERTRIIAEVNKKKRLDELFGVK